MTSDTQLREAAERADLIERLTHNADERFRRGTDDKGQQTTRARVDDLRSLLDRLAAAELEAEHQKLCAVGWFDKYRAAETRALSAEAQRDEALAARDALRKRFIEPYATLEAAIPQPWRDFIIRLSESEKRAEAQLAEALTALEPFAVWIKAARGRPWRPGPILTTYSGVSITVADFDRAASLLTRLGKGEGE